MGQSQQISQTQTYNIYTLFPNSQQIKQFKVYFGNNSNNNSSTNHGKFQDKHNNHSTGNLLDITKNQEKYSKCVSGIYINDSLGKFARLQSYKVPQLKRSAIQNYYFQRQKITQTPHIYQLIQLRLCPSVLPHNQKQSSIDITSTSLCSLSLNSRHAQTNNQAESTLYMFVQTSALTLEDQIINRRNKKPFEQLEIWSVLSSCVLGAISLLSQEFKEPVLSPKGIGLNKEGVIKIGEWEFVGGMGMPANSHIEEGELIFNKFGTPINQFNKNSLNHLLINYYWAPQGLQAIQKFLSIGQKQSRSSNSSHRSSPIAQNFQVFSLGMTLLSMCLRNQYYRTDTFSQKHLLKLYNQAIQIRKIQGKQLSNEMKYIIQNMIKWDASQRIGYLQLRDLILRYFSQHPQEMRSSTISVRSFQAGMAEVETRAVQVNAILINDKKCRKKSQISHTSMNLTQQNSIIQQCSFARLEPESVPKVKTSVHNIKIFKQRANKQKNNQIQNSFNNNSYESSGFEINSGSGMVQPGSGDNDQYLQQLQQSRINNPSQPPSHRTLKQSFNKHINKLSDKNNSPYMLIEDNKTDAENVSRDVSAREALREIKINDLSNFQKGNSKNEIYLKAAIVDQAIGKQKVEKQSKQKHSNQKSRTPLKITENKQNQQSPFMHPQSFKISKNKQNLPVLSSFRIPLSSLQVQTRENDCFREQSQQYHYRCSYKNKEKDRENMGSNSQRGSYRCSYKQPPVLLGSGRGLPSTYSLHSVEVSKSFVEEKRYPTTTMHRKQPSSQCTLDKAPSVPYLNRQKNLEPRTSIPYQFNQAKLQSKLSPIPLELDQQQDLPNMNICYEFFYGFTDDEERQQQNPDIFESFQECQESQFGYEGKDIALYPQRSQDCYNELQCVESSKGFNIKKSKLTYSCIQLQPRTKIIQKSNSSSGLFGQIQSQKKTQIKSIIGPQKQVSQLQEEVPKHQLMSRVTNDKNKNYDNKDNDRQFMTFNKKQTTTIEESFRMININPSKWKKPQIDNNLFAQKQVKSSESFGANKYQNRAKFSSQQQYYNYNHNHNGSKKSPKQNNTTNYPIGEDEQQNLFTDPKLLQYIRSPIRPMSPQAELNFNCSIQRRQENGNEGRKLNADKVTAYGIDDCGTVEQNKENLSHFCNWRHGSSLQDKNSSDFNHLNSHNKLVKEKFSRGFYQGQKKNGMRSGYGVFYYNQGGKYKGNWLNNKMHGKGTLQYSDGRIAYQGEWLNDQLHGKGILYNQSPNFQNQPLNYENLDQLDQCWIFYQGQFKHDDKCGMGLLVLSNQEQFIGEFKADMAEGFGQYLRMDGTIVRGVWSRNRLLKVVET